jgi:hypothetical protein
LLSSLHLVQISSRLLCWLFIQPTNPYGHMVGSHLFSVCSTVSLLCEPHHYYLC